MSWTEEMNYLASLCAGKTVLEMGSAVGASTVRLAKQAKVVHSVDWHYGDKHNGESDTLPAYLEEVRGVSNIIPHIGRFEDVCPALRGGWFDVVFIDGYHTHEAVERDINLAIRLVTAHGVLAFHDYTIEEFGVKQAVDEAFSRHSVQLVHSLALVQL